MKNKVLIVISAVIILSCLVLIQSIHEIETDELTEVSVKTPEVLSAVPVEQPESTASKRTIFLTFDDGPSEYTGEILKILDDNGIKATFFVTGDDEKYNGFIAEEYSRGHSVGIHCMNHKYYNVYHSESRFWDDFDQIDNLIFDCTGEHTKLMRFPGGSSNTVAKAYGVYMKNLISQAEEKGYEYFDWDVDSTDSQDKPSKDRILENMKCGAEECKEFCIILCHDTIAETVDAVRDFVPWALENGFIFDKLTNESPAVHHVEVGEGKTKP